MHKKESILILILFAAAAFYLFSKIKFGINIYDEGITLYGAVGVLEGHIPYRDFYYLYPPGNIYVLALIFKGFGPSILISRMFNSIILLLILVGSYLITKKLISDKISILLSFFLITILLGMDESFNVLSIPILLILLSTIFIFYYFDRKILHNLVILGILTGLTAYFRLDFAFYLFFSISLILCIFHYNYYMDLGYNKVLSLFKAEEYLLLYGSVCLLTIIPLIIFLLYYVPIDQLISQFITYPTKIYPVYSYMPWSYQYFNLIPIFIYLATSLLLASKLIKGSFCSKKDLKVSFLLFLGLTLIYYAKVRPDVGHFFPTLIISLILLSYICSEIFTIIGNFTQIIIKSSNKNLFRFFIIVLMIGSLLFYSTLLFTNKGNNLTSIDLERGNGIYVSQQDDFLAAAKYIQQNVPPYEKIFVGNNNTDDSDVNNVMFYYLSGRDSGVFYYDLEPGVVTTLPVQLEMIQELEQNNVQYIVLWNGDENPNIMGNGVMNLDYYIKSHYNLTKTFGNYSIYIIKNNIRQ